MSRLDTIIEKTGRMHRVSLGNAIVTHGKGGIGTVSRTHIDKRPSLKKSVSGGNNDIYCHACGIVADRKMCYEHTDLLSGNQQEMCISKCNFGCFPRH